MVEVFKTTVDNHAVAYRLTEAIHRQLPGCRANFDLDDCDRILRVECTQGTPDACVIISLVISHGCFAEVLDDAVESVAKPLTSQA